MKKYYSLFPILLLFAIISCSDQPVKIACVGDSITAGSGLKSPSKSAYPVILDKLLGPEYKVLNFGRGGATMLKNGNWPYWNVKEFSNVFAEEPDLIIIKLGTNDTKPVNWDPGMFIESYRAMIDTFMTISTQPSIFLCLPVPAHFDQWGINDSTIIHGVIPAVEQIAEEYGLPLINLYEPLKKYPQYFPDGIHPNEEGMKVMAKVIAEEIK